MEATSSPSNSKRCNSCRAVRFAAAVFAAAVSAGCTSTRVGNSLGWQGNGGAELGGPYFVVSSEGMHNFDPVFFNRLLHDRYPGLFAQTPEAVPIMIRIEQGATQSTDAIGPFFLGLVPMVLTCGMVGSYWQTDRAQLNVTILVSPRDEALETVEIEANHRMHGLLFTPVAKLFQPSSEGWHQPRGDLVAEEFEALVNATADALFRVLDRLTPGQRAALRRNPVALQRFQKKFPWGFGVQKSGVARKIIHVYPDLPEGIAPPEIVGRSFDASTRRGEIRADFSGREYVAAQRWLVNSAVPRLCRDVLGRDISLIYISGETLDENQLFTLSFVVVE